MVLMSGLSNWARESFKRILNLLKQKRRGVVKTVSPIIKVLENGRWIRKRVPLESEFADTYEEEVRRRYGKNVRIERLEFHRTKPWLMQDMLRRLLKGTVMNIWKRLLKTLTSLRYMMKSKVLSGWRIRSLLTTRRILKIIDKTVKPCF